MTDESLN